MTTTVADILTGIKAIVVAELGAEYRELPFSLDVAKNKFQAGTKAYAAWAGPIVQAEGVNSYVTVDQAFNLTLTESYGSSQVSDAQQRVAGQSLYERFEQIYVKVSAQKAGVPSRVMIVQRLSVPSLSFLDGTAILSASFELKYRTAK